METVRQILARKGSGTWSVAPGAMVQEALQLMAEKEVGALLVMEGDRLAGILSERDYARKVFLQGKSSLSTPVREIMTQRVIAIPPDRTVEECMALMSSYRIRHLPVVEGERVVGLVSIGDIVKASLEEKDFLIEQLEKYITGQR